MTNKIIIPNEFTLRGKYVKGWIDCLVSKNIIYRSIEATSFTAKEFNKKFICCKSVKPAKGSEIIYGDDIIAVNKNVYGDRIAPKKPRILEHITVYCLYNSYASKEDLYDWGLRLKVYVKPCDITAICPEPFFYDEGDKKALESREVYCTQFFVPRYNRLYIEDKKLKYEAPPKISEEEAKEKYLKSKDLIITLE